ncbi:hypothetical protein E3P91_04182 [Wallemia ichthyophaga]|nr:hypothetical protein E3P91_04182 [Wallemia ichthyophaga]
MDLGHQEVILGMSFLEEYEPTIDFVTRQVWFPTQEKQHRSRFAGVSGAVDKGTEDKTVRKKPEVENDVPKFKIVSANQIIKDVRKADSDDVGIVGIDSSGNRAGQEDINEDSVSCMNIGEVSKDLERLIVEFKDVFPDELPKTLPPRREVEHGIELVDGAKPPSRSPYRLSFTEQDELKKQLKQLVDSKLIRPSTSPYGSPVLFVRKKSGELRMCIDYRALNNITIKNRYPIPRMDEILDQLAPARYFSKLDLTSGYWQMRIKDEDVPKTAFTSKFGHYEFMVMPFGLCNAPSSFQYLMNSIFQDLLDEYVVVYLDDIMVYSRTKKDHLQHLTEIFRRLRDYKLYVKLKKCEFMKSKVEYLGHIVGNNSITPDVHKTKAIRDWDTPKNSADVMSFMGLANFYRKFVPNFGKRTKNLTDIMSRKADFVWTNLQQQEFDDVKGALTVYPVLRLPTKEGDFRVHTDASEYAIGAVLEQEDITTKDIRPVAYFSKKLTGAQVHYPTHVKELFAIKESLESWRQYLEGRRFSVYTDHYSLQYIRTQPELSKLQRRWVERLADFDCEIIYKPGKTNVVADALSRRNHNPEELGIKEENPEQSCREEDKEIFEKDNEQDKKIDSKDTMTGSKSLQLHYIDSDSIENSIKEKLKEEIKRDKEFNEIYIKLINREEIQKQEESTYKHYRITGGLLVFAAQPGEEERLVVPDGEIRRKILFDYHNSITAGHLGFHRTYALLQRQFYWPRMAKCIKNYVNRCEDCQRNKSSRRLPQGFLHPLPIAKDKWDRISMDFITSLPLTREGYDSVWVVSDSISKRAHFIPTHTTVTSEKLAPMFIKEIYRLHGIPREIVSDRGPQFISKFWRTLNRLFGTRLSLSSTKHAQTNGHTERNNATLENIIRMYTNRQLDNWTDILPFAEFAYNDSKNSVTDKTPFEIDTGQHPRRPGLMPKQEEDDGEAFDYGLKISNYVKEAQDAIHAAQQSATRLANRGRRAIEIKVGDYVYVHKNAFTFHTSKLNRLWFGPYRVLKKINTSFQLDIPSDTRMHNVIHASHLKAHLTPIQPPSQSREVKRVYAKDSLENNHIGIQELVQEHKPPFEGRENVRCRHTSTNSRTFY